VREERFVAGIQSKHLLAQAVTVSLTLLLSPTFSSAPLISFLFLLFLVSFLFHVRQFLTFSHALCVQCALIFQILYHISLAGPTRAPIEPCADYVNLLYMVVEIPFFTVLKPRQKLYCTYACNSA